MNTGLISLSPRTIEFIVKGSFLVGAFDNDGKISFH